MIGPCNIDLVQGSVKVSLLRGKATSFLTRMTSAFAMKLLFRDTGLYVMAVFSSRRPLDCFLPKMLKKFFIQKHDPAIFISPFCLQLQLLNWNHLKSMPMHTRTHTHIRTLSCAAALHFNLQKPDVQPFSVTYQLSALGHNLRAVKG